MSLRVAMITRRYWPMVGGAETMMSHLANEFRRQGAKPTIVTAQWRADWPVYLRHLGSPVVRLPSPKPASWGAIRYLTSLSRWLRKHQHEFDGVLVSRLQYDGYVALSALKRSTLPVVLRAESAGETGDCRWLEQTRFSGRLRRTLQTAAAIIAPNRQIADEVRQVGFEAEQIETIANGVRPAPLRSPLSRQSARLALAEANHDLSTPPNATVVLAVSKFEPSRRLADLVRAFRSLADANRNAALWLIGDGPERDRLYRQIVDAGLHHQIFMPGIFDDLDDLMQAADIFVDTTDQDSRTAATLQAMSYGLPVLVAKLPCNQELIRDGVNGKLATAGDIEAWAEALLQLADQPLERETMGEAARRTMSAFTITQCASKHLQLLKRKIDAHRTN